jgi:hypothetical protein
MSQGHARPRSRELRQVRKEAAVNGVRVRRREARVCELMKADRPSFVLGIECNAESNTRQLGMAEKRRAVF